jgi:hypothetical protein
MAILNAVVVDNGLFRNLELIQQLNIWYSHFNNSMKHNYEYQKIDNE